jgi:hypothetical protein
VGEKENTKTGKWFILLVAAGMIALATWGSYKTVCIPDISPAEPQPDSSQIWTQNYAFTPDTVNVPPGMAVHWTNLDGSFDTVT